MSPAAASGNSGIIEQSSFSTAPIIDEAVCELEHRPHDKFFRTFQLCDSLTRVSLPRSKIRCIPPLAGEKVLLMQGRKGTYCVEILEPITNPEVVGDLWDFHTKGHWVCITTNGVVNKSGEAVMGAGVALQAKERFPELPRILAKHLKNSGNHPLALPEYNIVTFPTKGHWRNQSIVTLIRDSYLRIITDPVYTLWRSRSKNGILYLPRPGCANGGLEWEDVKQELLPMWNRNVIIITKE